MAEAKFSTVSTMCSLVDRKHHDTVILPRDHLGQVVHTSPRASRVIIINVHHTHSYGKCPACWKCDCTVPDKCPL